MPPVEHLVWTKSGHAEVVQLEGDHVVLRSTAPVPPGARATAKLGGLQSALVKIKSHGSKRRDDGSFTLKGRLLDPTRAVRETLASLAGGFTPSRRL